MKDTRIGVMEFCIHEKMIVLGSLIIKNCYIFRIEISEEEKEKKDRKNKGKMYL